MSLILEALRKSEAERRRGQAPDLYGAAPLAPSPRREGFGQWPIVAGGLLVLLALALLFWPRAPQLEQPRSADSAHGAATADTDDIAAPLAAGQVSDPVRAPLASPPPSDATPRDTLARPVGTSAATGMPGLATRPAPAPAPPALQQAAPSAAQQTAQPPPPPPAQPPPNTDRGAVIPPAEALPSLATLSVAERAALPPLKLSVHVWNSDPTQRFAIVDGQRIVEGAALGSAVVAEIRRDGIVLDVNGQRVLLPRP